MSDFHLVLEEQIPQLMRYAAALARDPDEAVELVEDTVREALTDEHRCPRDAVKVWLLTILHDLRGNPFRQMTLASAAAPRAGELLTLSDLDRAMGQLPEEQRAVILLIGLENLSYSETAAVLRISASSLRSRLARARERLRREMGVAETRRIARAAA